MLSVVGRGSVTLFDGSHMVTNAHLAKERRPILASGVVLHVLPAGCRVRPDHARRWCAPSRRWTPPRPTNWRWPTVICARWHVTSRLGTSPPRVAPPHRPTKRRSSSDRRVEDSRPADHARDGGPAEPRSRDRRDPGLSRRQRLVLRQGDPPRGRPRGRSRSSRPTPSRASPTTCSRRCPGCASTPAHAAAAAASSSGSTRAPGSATSPSTSPSPLQQVVGHDIRRGKTRAGQGRRRAATTSSTATSTSRSGWRPAGSPYAWSTTSSRPTRSSTWSRSSTTFILRAQRTAFGPSTQAILDEAVSRDIPWIRLNKHSLVQLGQGVHAKRIRATMTSRDQLDRGRHRLRQGPHHPAARRRRPPGAQAGVRAYGGPGGQRRRADRLPGRRQAARRQPRPRGVPEPAGRATTCARRSRSPRSSRAAAGSIVESFITGKDYRCLIIDGKVGRHRRAGAGQRHR